MIKKGGGRRFLGNGRRAERRQAGAGPAEIMILLA
jgi:hypothetical protein